MHCASRRETKSTGATSAYELKPLVSLHPAPTQRSPWMKPPPTPRGALTTTDDETRLVAPAALQSALDDVMAAVPQGRCFVRPSGTEDVVRVYAEAATQADADALALKTAQAVHELAGGVGEKPTAV